MVAVLASGLALAVAPIAAADTGCAGLESGPTRTVIRIIDGETVALDDGTELRLIGALAPRAIDVDGKAGTWQPEAATMQGLRALVLGKSIALAFSAGARTDRHGRWQAQAFVLAPDGGRRWVQGHLLASGLARAYATAGHRGCSVELLAAERAASLARRGLWNDAAYQIRSADRPAELMRYRATFQVVEGRLLRAAGRRATIYLRFARNWRRGFSVSLRRADRELLGSFGGDPRGLEGRRVRVRGWIEQWRGAPMIDLSTAGALEVISEDGGSAGVARERCTTLPEKRC
ncbi:MAG TPA: thermonuclease family protein [Hyphomicrobiaceae bacterium]|nr:thermonuclease family protein [Hyphomicrobiaceae bacterium]